MLFRRASIDDVPVIADVMTRVDPDEPWDPVLWRHNWETWTISGFPSRSYLVLDAGAVAGVAEWWMREPPPGELRLGSLRVGLLAEDSAAMRECLSMLEGDLREMGVNGFAASTREDEHFRPAELRATGYRPDRLSRRWELDLAANRDRLRAMAAPACERMARQGIEVLTIADAERSDPGVLRKVYEVDRLATQDVPTTVPHVTPPFEGWLHDLTSPGLRKDRMWVACAGPDVLGMSWLKYPPVRGNVWTDWTGVAPAARGRGIAGALKLQTLLQAIEVGVGRVRTENDEENAPILHINEQMGYRAIPGTRLWLKDAEGG